MTQQACLQRTTRTIRAPTRPLPRARRFALCLATLAALAGCKGGGGGGGGADLPDASLISSASEALGVLEAYYVKSFDAFEAKATQLRENSKRYTRQNNRWSFKGAGQVHHSYPLASSRVEYAHAAGLRGRGQIVSVIDEGFRLSHEALRDRKFFDPGYDVGLADHGTAVASVLAGDAVGMVGIAPSADLALGRFDSSAHLARATWQALSLGAVAQNNSWGYTDLPATPTGVSRAFAGPDGADYLDALKAYASEGVVVFAVSNDETRTQSLVMEALPKMLPSLEPGWLAVVNAVPDFDAERILSAQRLSAGCLDAARWCLAADGGWDAANAASDTAYRFVTGSSFAVPQVSGALALLGEAFPNLTPHQLRIRLLASADNGFFSHDGTVELAPGFEHGYNREFGHGFLDIRSALLPIGTRS